MEGKFLIDFLKLIICMLFTAVNFIWSLVLCYVIDEVCIFMPLPNL